MSFGNAYNGGRTRYATKVLLNVYDLAPANDYLYPVGLGLHHSGVEIMGTEYSFASGSGIFESYSPGQVPGAKFREQIEMGQYDGGQAELKKALDELRIDFGPGDYNLLRRNCNHFANALCWKLLGTKIPGHINRLSDLAMCCSCLLPRDLLDNAPVGDPNHPPTATSANFMVRAGRVAPSNNTTTVPAFAGTGAKLGSTSQSETQGVSNNNHRTSPDDLTDRREKARKAALARLEQQQQQQKQN